MLLPPQRVPLRPAQEPEAVALLAEMVLETAAKRRRLRSGGVFGGASDGVSGSVIPLPATRGKARKAA